MMNVERYPWLSDLSSKEALEAIQVARQQLKATGAVVFHNFITDDALEQCAREAQAREEAAFTTDDLHTAYLQARDTVSFPKDSVYNHEMRTQVASIAFDELPRTSPLVALYQNKIMLELVSQIVDRTLYLSEDPLGCCSINVFRPGYHHSFHFDESEFSTTLMLQDSQVPGTGLFQYTHPLRDSADDLTLSTVAQVISAHDKSNGETKCLAELRRDMSVPFEGAVPKLWTLDFRPGTLSIFSGSKSLHRVTKVEGQQSRLVAVLTFSPVAGFCNSARVQKLFWGRSSSALRSSEPPSVDGVTSF